MTGTLISLHLDDKLGSYGILLGEDGKHYVWSAGHMYRNGTHPIVGESYQFEESGFGYATKIDAINKVGFK